MRKMIGLFLMIAFIALIAGCVEVSELEYIEFETYPKTTYLVGEDLEDFQITYKLKTEETAETLAFDDEMVVITGFSTETPGTYTMTVSLQGYDDASLNFVYTVVTSMIDTMFAGGYGTQDEPYLIETAQQLSNMRLFDGTTYTYFKLIDDIDLSGFDWVPIGNVSFILQESGYEKAVVTGGFYGDLNGNNKSITNYTVTGDVTSQSGAIALFQGSIRDDDGGAYDSKIYDLSVTDVNIDATNVDSYRAGVLFGVAFNISFENVTVTGNVTIDNTSRATVGIFGSLGNNVRFENCEADVTVTAKGNFQVYGFGYIGWSMNGKKGGNLEFINSSNYSNIVLLEDTTSSYVGSFLGIVYSGGLISMTNSNNYQAVLVTGQTPYTETIVVASLSGTLGTGQNSGEALGLVGYFTNEQTPDAGPGSISITNTATYFVND